MSKRRIFLLVCGLVIAVAVVGAAVWSTAVRITTAQETDPSAPDTATSAEESGADLEAFRSRLVEFYGDLLQIEPYLAEFADPGLRERIIKAQEMVADLAPEHLAELEEVFSENPALFDAPRRLLAEPGVLSDLSQAAQRGVAEGLEYGVGGSQCGSPVSVHTVYIAKAALQAWDISMLFVPRDFVQVILGEGGTLTAHPAWLLLGVVKEVAEVALTGVEWLHAAVDSCLQQYHRDLVNDRVDNNLDAKVSDTAKQDYLESIAPQVHGAPAPGASQASLNEIATDVEAIKNTLDDEVAYRKVDLEVVQLLGKNKFVVAASVEGIGLGGELDWTVGVLASASSFTDVTARTTFTDLGRGRYRVEISLSAIDASGRVVSFEVRQNSHRGRALFLANGSTWW